MNLDLFLRSLESEFDARRRADADALVDELAQAERVALALADRIAAREGEALRVIVRGGEPLEGLLVHARKGWILLRDDLGDALIPLSAIVAASPLGMSADCSRATAGIAISSVLRALANERMPVVVDHDAGRHAGVILGVFTDHFDMEANAPGTVIDSRDRSPGGRFGLAHSGIRYVRTAGVRSYIDM